MIPLQCFSLKRELCIVMLCYKMCCTVSRTSFCPLICKQVAICKQTFLIFLPKRQILPEFFMEEHPGKNFWKTFPFNQLRWRYFKKNIYTPINHFRMLITWKNCLLGPTKQFGKKILLTEIKWLTSQKIICQKFTSS